MAIVEQVRILCEGKGDYRIINKRDLKKSDVVWVDPSIKPKKKTRKKR